MSSSSLPDNGKQSDFQNTWVHRVLGDQNFRQERGFFAWWYRFTSPSDAPAGATFQERDRIRRGRLASALMLFLFLVLLIASSIGFYGQNHTILVVTSTMLVAIILSIPLNRHGLVSIVGVVMCLGLTGGMYTSMLFAPGGMSPADKDILYLLFFSDLFVAAILPVNAVFLVAGINIAFSIYALTFANHTPALTALLAHGGYATILGRLIQIHIIVAGVMWIVINNLKTISRRADRAEEIARLQRNLMEMEQVRLQEAQALAASINVIKQVHAQIANGNLSARVPLTQENVLWEISGQLNNLMNRYQRGHLKETELDRFSQDLTEARFVFQKAVQEALQQQQPVQLQLPANSPLAFLHLLDGQYLTNTPSEQRKF